MNAAELLKQHRESWIEKLAQRIVKGEELREGFKSSLNELFEAMQRSLESGDPEWLELVLERWVEARPHLEAEEMAINLPPLLGQILIHFIEIVQEGLSPRESLDLLRDLLPHFLKGIVYVSQKEMELQIESIAESLEKTRLHLEKLDRNKSDFISIAAHELKTPLTLIEGYSAMLKDLLHEFPDASQANTLINGIENGARRLKEIVDDMIDVSLIDNEMLSLHFQPLWIAQILDAIRYDVEEVLADRSQRFEIHPFEGAEELTFGDVERLQQAIRNIVLNAIKFTPDGGRITIDGRLLPGFIEVRVQDTGVGIDPADHFRIFDKFSNTGDVALHSTGKTKYLGKGAGLGLPISKGIIEAHGGTIWVESEGFDPQRCPGSTFHILIPVRKTPPDDKSAKLFHPFAKEEFLQSDESA